MMIEHRQVLVVCSLVTSLVLAGCDTSPDKLVSPGEQVNPTDGHQLDTPGPADVAAEHKDNGKVAPASETRKPQKPLDLSLPPQPAVISPAGERATTSTEPILPDLFKLEQEDDRSRRLKGQVLMEQGAEKSLDAMEGGRITIEMKTR